MIFNIRPITKHKEKMKGTLVGLFIQGINFRITEKVLENLTGRQREDKERSERLLTRLLT
jgi:hypothetical protein